MKAILLELLAAAVFANAVSCRSAQSAGPESLPSRAVNPRPCTEAEKQWWRDAKFGLFIHWGPASVNGTEISWSRIGHPHDHPAKPTVPPEVYDHLYERFNPVKFNADQWMSLARQAGCKYVVFVTKHHDGFCMWPSKLTGFNIAHSPFQRDICREIADAAQKQGLKLGWYYSTRDWTHPDYLVGGNSKYNDYYEGQLRELLTNYGKVDVVWFDHVAGNWRDYRFKQLFQMIYGLQPGVLVNDRAAKFFLKVDDKPDPSLFPLVKGDFDTPEQKIGTFQHGRAWESCMTMTKCVEGGGWSYRPDGTTIPFVECVRTRVNCATGDGNLLLNVGPMRTGEIQPDQVNNLKRVGQWLAKYGDSIYGTRGGPFINGEWGGSTYRGDKVFLHVFKWTGESLSLAPLKEKVLSANVLTGGEVAVNQTASGLTLTLAAASHDPLDTIIELSLESQVAENLEAK